ncbi:MAG: hypothetical protein GY795_33440 [Desulfobacterales bacterium]|nr:hypothetical protein [Desulfobacterales bacterium]
MSSTINQLLIKYRAGGINMPYTVEDYRNELERNVLKSMTSEKILDELLKKTSAEEILKRFSSKEIEAFLKKQATAQKNMM